MRPKVGVYICHCGLNIAQKVDVEKVREVVSTHPYVTVSRDYKFMCSDPGQELIINDIKEYKLDSIVVAACSPRMHEDTFQKAIAKGGINRFKLVMANIREHCSWVTESEEEATQKAIQLVWGAVNKAVLLEAIEVDKKPVTKAVCVVGGGIAGIQASLDLADSGIKVYLIEREQSIGGHMAQLDKTFPTLDCSACILTPKMVQVGEHPNIELMSYSEIEEVSGSVGSFKIKVRKKAKYVDYSKCTGCGVCMEKCPKKVNNEFDLGLSKRKAIYVMFPQAVPNKPVIDKENCTYFIKGKCRICEKFCEVGAIKWDDEDKIVEIEVGTVIIATGYTLYDISSFTYYGYGIYPDVYTALEFERMSNASGPTGGKIVKRDGTPPQAVGIIHCVGSRDEHHKNYCSRVCCMYAVKFAHLIREKVGATVYNFFLEMRAFGKGYEEFYKRVQKEGVRFIRGKPARVTNRAEAPEEEGKLIIEVEDTLSQRNLRVPVDMVILAPAMVASNDSERIARLFGLSRSSDGFFLEAHPKLRPVSTHTDGIYLAGCCQGPKDIPDTVAQASASASQAKIPIEKGYIETEPWRSVIREEKCKGCGTCVLACPYSAISLVDTYKEGYPVKVARIDGALCKGCGVCVAACPAGAPQQYSFNDSQLLNEISGLIRGGL